MTTSIAGRWRSRRSVDNSSAGVRSRSRLNGTDGGRDEDCFGGHIGASSRAVGHGGWAGGDSRRACGEDSRGCELRSSG